jgi:hypothetical protein
MPTTAGSAAKSRLSGTPRPSSPVPRPLSLREAQRIPAQAGPHFPFQPSAFTFQLSTFSFLSEAKSRLSGTCFNFQPSAFTFQLYERGEIPPKRPSPVPSFLTPPMHLFLRVNLAEPPPERISVALNFVSVLHHRASGALVRLSHGIAPPSGAGSRPSIIPH